MYFYIKQKTCYELRNSDWISDVCASDLPADDKQHRVCDRIEEGCYRFTLGSRQARERDSEDRCEENERKKGVVRRGHDRVGRDDRAQEGGDPDCRCVNRSRKIGRAHV